MASYGISQDDDGQLADASRPHLADLLAAVATGQESAFDQVYAQLFFPVYRMALAVLQDRDQAEEVAQDVLTEIWLAASRFNPVQGSAVGWALLIARRRAIDRVRSVAADARRERKNTTAPMSLMQCDPVAEAADEIYDREQLRRALDSLSRPHRRVVELAFYGGYRHADIAIILDLPLGTVKSRIRTALTRIRAYMQANSLSSGRDPLCNGWPYPQMRSKQATGYPGWVARRLDPGIRRVIPVMTQ